jgi:hypothetical protein
MNDAFPQSVHEQAWEGICAELLATLPCDLEKAPSGPSAKIIEIGRLFACASTLTGMDPGVLKLADPLLARANGPCRRSLGGQTRAG